MKGVRLRDVVEADLPILFEHQQDPEASRMAAFPSRDREAFLAHWRTKILGDATAAKKTILLDGRVAGNIVIAWIVTIPASAGIAALAYWVGLFI